MNQRQIALSLLAAGTLLLSACAEVRPRGPVHPAYAHAMSDLRAARWALEHRPGDASVSGMEDVAITEIDRALDEARRAAWENGQNPNARPPVDANLNRPGRLHQADQLLRRAHDDIAREEDNPQARGLRDGVVAHIDAAIRATDRAIRDVEIRR